MPARPRPAVVGNDDDHRLGRTEHRTLPTVLVHHLLRHDARENRQETAQPPTPSPLPLAHCIHSAMIDLPVPLCSLAPL